MVTGEVVIVKTWDFTPYQKWKELQANGFITIVHTSHIFYLQSWPSMILNFGHILFLFATMHVQWFFHFYDFLKNRNTRYDKDLKLNTVAFLAPTNVWETWFVWLYNITLCLFTIPYCWWRSFHSNCRMLTWDKHKISSNACSISSKWSKSETICHKSFQGCHIWSYRLHLACNL